MWMWCMARLLPGPLLEAVLGCQRKEAQLPGEEVPEHKGARKRVFEDARAQDEAATGAGERAQSNSLP